VFYTTSIAFGWLGLAAAGIALIVVLTYFKVWYTPVYVVLGVVVWYAMFRSGVHATISGVILGLLAPATPLLGERAFENVEDVLSGDRVDPGSILDAKWKMTETMAVTTRLTQFLSPWTGFIIVPLFALANAGIPLSAGAFEAAIGSRVTFGVFFGLVIGKTFGVTLFSYLAVRLNWASLPQGVNFAHLLGGGAVAGIGFTVALFIAKLAFVDEAGRSTALADEAIMGVLAASLVATLLGLILLRWVAPVFTAERRS
jgi:NhaA family Na+:H+ antiporter